MKGRTHSGVNAITHWGFGCLGGDWVDLGVSLSGDVGIWFLALAAVSLLACGVGDGIPSGCRGLQTSHVA